MPAMHNALLALAALLPYVLSQQFCTNTAEIQLPLTWWLGRLH